MLKTGLVLILTEPQSDTMWHYLKKKQQLLLPKIHADTLFWCPLLEIFYSNVVMLVCHLNKTKDKNYAAFSLKLFHNCHTLLNMKLKLQTNNMNT